MRDSSSSNFANSGGSKSLIVTSSAGHASAAERVTPPWNPSGANGSGSPVAIATVASGISSAACTMLASAAADSGSSGPSRVMVPSAAIDARAGALPEIGSSGMKLGGRVP